jgi:tetratricopeptide (TPR) repeat protein
VIGLVSVGAQAWADRYSYIALIGPVWALAWGATSVIDGARRPSAGTRRTLAALAACALLGACLVLTLRQVTIWRDTQSLWQHALAVEPRNYKAALLLGDLRSKQGRDREALAYYRRAHELAPRIPRTELHLALVLLRFEDYQAAYPHLLYARAAYPKDPRVHTGLGLAANQRGERAEALAHFERAAALAPEDAMIREALRRLRRAASAPRPE